MDGSGPLSGIGSVGSLLVLFILITAILAFLMPFFVLRIRNEIISMNKKMSKLISLLENSGEDGISNTDPETNPKVEKRPLEWIVGPNQDTTWNEANAWLESLNKKGGDWRFPTIKEIEALCEINGGLNSFAQQLKTYGRFLWAKDTDHYWAKWSFDLQEGSSKQIYRDKADKQRAIAVRNKKFTDRF